MPLRREIARRHFDSRTHAASLKTRVGHRPLPRPADIGTAKVLQAIKNIIAADEMFLRRHHDDRKTGLITTGKRRNRAGARMHVTLVAIPPLVNHRESQIVTQRRGRVGGQSRLCQRETRRSGQ